MKKTPQENIIHKNFLPGVITKEGFLGDDPRHVHEIVNEDTRILARLNRTPEQVADRLQFFIEQGKKGLETKVDLGDYTVQIIWSRGLLPCPFEEPRLHHKITCTVEVKDLNRTFKYSQLSVHMIREHGFFGGRGSPFRLNPTEMVELLGA
ncbi:hypothetical protein GF337_08535 [candidate division KSB1 bacterium]|nr:hypothetical protein [candidate division KSB1 bacterium]